MCNENSSYKNWNYDHMTPQFGPMCIGGYDDVDEEMDVSEANFLVSQASKPSAGARIFRGLKSPEILVLIIMIVFFNGYKLF